MSSVSLSLNDLKMRKVYDSQIHLSSVYIIPGRTKNLFLARNSSVPADVNLAVLN